MNALTKNLPMILKALFCIAGVLQGAMQANATDLFWNPPSGNQWTSSAENWATTSGGLPTQGWATEANNGDIAIFDGTDMNVSLAENLSAGGLRFRTDGYTLSAAALQTLHLTGANPDFPVIEVATGGTATLGSNIRIMSDSKRFVKTGGGELVISYTADTGEQNYYFGGISKETSGSIGSRIVVAEGTLRLSSNAINNTFTSLHVDAGAQLIVNSQLSIAGLAGAGTIVAEGEETGPQLRLRGTGGAGSNFSGVISGNGSLFKFNGTETQTFSGTQSNTFTGSLTITVGRIILDKTEGAIAMSGTKIVLGGASSRQAPILELLGEGQVVDTADLVFSDDGKSVSTVRLNGNSLKMNQLDVSAVSQTGMLWGDNIIDLGVNSTAQIIQFNDLTAATNGILNFINFEIGQDSLRFNLDPTEDLFALKINGEDTVALHRGAYWEVAVIPEPSLTVLGLLGTGMVLLQVYRRREHGVSVD